MLFNEHRAEVYGIYFAIILSYIVILFVQLLGIRFFVKILLVPAHLLNVAVAVMCVIGTYAIRDSIFDVYTMAAVGLMGYLLIRARIPITPVVLGLVLGETLEKEYRTAVILSDGHYDIFYRSPTALAFFALALIVIGLQAWSSMRERAQPAAREKEA